MKTVWIVNEGSPGHFSQSEGLVNALAEKMAVQSVVVKGRMTVRGVIRPLVRKLMGSSGRALPDFLLKRIADVEIPAGSPEPNLIVSSGGKSIVPARTLAVRYNAPYVYIGGRLPYPEGWFHTVITANPAASSSNSIDVELIPTPVSPQFIASKGEVEENTWCMIIGGASRSHPFDKEDWKSLAEGMNALAERENIRWLITTSRRTGAAAESILKKHLNPDILKDAIWWADKPRKELYSFIARSEVLFVTQDSVTMVTEAVSAGKPVVVVHPATVSFPTDSFLPTYFDRLRISGRLTRIQAHSLAMLDFNSLHFNLLQKGVLDQVSGEVAERVRGLI